MIYKEFDNKKLSLLGFGCMRLPLKDGNIDTEEFQKMVDYAMEHGVNYYDTANPYHGGYSEIELGKALRKYPRESFFIATKYPGHQIASSYNPEEKFEEQLKKCQVDYFDFYLLHNVYEKSIEVYEDPKWGIMDYFIKQKELGRIKYLGISSHAKLETLKQFVSKYRDVLDFCQLQINYLDWTLQDAEAKYDFLTENNIPVWVMEPVRGGKLAKHAPKIETRMKEFRPDETVPAWCFRFLQKFENIHMILSGMSSFDQMVDNVKTFEEAKPLNKEETNYIMEVAEGMKNAVPCTACGYCKDGCPCSLNIPSFIAAYNDLKTDPQLNNKMWIEALPENERPHACIQCGQCASICPQGIDVPNVLRELCKIYDSLPSWADISRQREEEAKKLKK